jgi:hypothetical protein
VTKRNVQLQAYIDYQAAMHEAEKTKPEGAEK